MDLWTFIGGAVAVWLAYKLGLYVERKMRAKAQALEAQADAKAAEKREP